MHWLPVKLRINFKIEVNTFKAINGFASNYISSLIEIKQPLNYSLRSNNELSLQPLITGTKKTLGNKAFVSVAPKLWNGLPSLIRNAYNLIKFKSLLKTYYFNIL